MYDRIAITWLLLILCSPLHAGMVPMTPAWSGIWSDPSGQHRCAIQLHDATDPGALVLLCQFGQTALFGAWSPPPPSGGTQLLLQEQLAPFGQPPAGAQIWGQVLWFPVCDQQGPALYAAAYTPPTTVGFTLRPVLLGSSTPLCPPGSRGGAR